MTDHGFGGGDVDVWIGTVLQQCDGEVINLVQVRGGAGVLYHVHQGEENVLCALTEPVCVRERESVCES